MDPSVKEDSYADAEDKNRSQEYTKRSPSLLHMNCVAVRVGSVSGDTVACSYELSLFAAYWMMRAYTHWNYRLKFKC